jgi:nucleotide-binding universal stress UspA family protein
MGIGRHDLAARLLGGEVALRTIRRASVPVLAVPDTPFRVPPRTAVAGIDFSPSSVWAARAALDLLGAGGTLHLVHVWARTNIDHPALLEQDDAYERALPGRFAAVERALVDHARDVTILRTSLLGGTAEQLADFARSHNADFIAAGARGHGLVERLVVGHVATGLIRTAPCAVLVTPEPQGAERADLELALAGTAEGRDRAEWADLLDAFSRRNGGRRTHLQVDDPALGAQARETG